MRNISFPGKYPESLSSCSDLRHRNLERSEHPPCTQLPAAQRALDDTVIVQRVSDSQSGSAGWPLTWHINDSTASG